jgi:hypothetical protein
VNGRVLRVTHRSVSEIERAKKPQTLVSIWSKYIKLSFNFGNTVDVALKQRAETAVEFGYGVSIIRIRFSKDLERQILDFASLNMVLKYETQLKINIIPPSPYALPISFQMFSKRHTR